MVLQRDVVFIIGGGIDVVGGVLCDCSGDAGGGRWGAGGAVAGVDV